MKKRIVCTAFLLSLILSACVLSACGGGGLQFPPYEYDYSQPVEDFGDGVRIDGKLEEDVWQGRKYLTADIRNTPVVYRMTSYFGDKGVYFAFDIADNAVFYNPVREIYANSGIEFCVGNPDDLEITYEIDLNAGGKRMLRKYTGQPYTNWFSDLHSSVSVQGEINTPSCTGYTAEIYLPYALFNRDGSDTPLDRLLVNPAIIRANSDSASASDTDRLWYSIGIEERGLGWAPASSNWYAFDRDGLVCYDVTLNASSNGTISGRHYLLSDETYRLSVAPDAGYCLDSLSVNGQDVSDDLTYPDGKAVYSFTGTGDTVIEATFRPLPQTQYTLSGTVSAEAGDLPENTVLYAAYAGSVTSIPIGADGRYSALLPTALYTLICDAEGLLRYRQQAELAGDLTHNVALRTLFLGTHTVIGSASNDSSWDFSALGQGTAVSLDNGWLVATNHTTLMGAKMFVSGEIVLPMRTGADRRAGFRFVDRTGNGIYVCLLASNEKGANRYEAQVIGLKNSDSASWPGSVELTDPAVRALANGDGVPFAALYEAGKTTVWVNGVKVLDRFSKDILLNEESEVVPGLVTCGGGTFHALKFDTTGYDDGYPVSVRSSGGGTVTCDKDTYADGDALTFTVTPGEGFAVTEILVNGADRLAELAGDTLSIDTTGMAGVYVRARFVRIQGRTGILSGTVTASGQPAPPVTLTLRNTSGETYTATARNGAFTFEAVTVGVWRLTVEAEGFLPYQETVVLTGDKQIAVELVKETMADKYVFSGGENYDVSAIESGKKIVYTGSGNNNLTLKAEASASDDVYMSAVLRKQDSFTLGTPGGMRYGLIFIGENRTLNFDLSYFTNPGAYMFSLVDWGVVDRSVPLSPAQVAAWESAAGLQIAAARINGKFYLFARDGAVMKQMVSGDHAALSGAAFRIGFGTWKETVGAEYTGVEWTIGDVAIDADVRPADNGTVAVSPTVLGGDVTVTVRPDDGYIVSSLLVNGVEKQSALVEIEGAYVLRLPAYTDTKELIVEATFAEQGAFSVTLNVMLHKYAIGPNNLAQIGDGAAVELRGLTTYSANALGGSVLFDAVEKGTYSVWVDGYRTAALVVSDTVDDTLTLAYDLIETSANIDTTEANNGSVTLKLNSSDAVLFTQAVGENEDFYVSALFQNIDKDAESLRFGFFAGHDFNGDGQLDGAWGGQERIYAPLCYQWYQGTREYVMQWIPTWAGYFMSEADAAAMATETGVRLGLARINGTFFMLREIDGQIKAVSHYKGDAKFASAAVRVGIATMDAKTANPADFAQLRFETAAKGSFAFADRAAAEGLKQGGARYTDLMGVTDPATRYKTDIGVVYGYQVDADLSAFSENGGTLGWSAPAAETVYFKNTVTDMTLTYTLKADIPQNERVTAFSIFDAAGPYVVSISRETNGSYLVSLMRHWSWAGNVTATLTQAQTDKMRAEGLAFKIVRTGSTVEVWVDDCAGESENLVKLAERTYEAQLGEAGCGIGVSGSAAEYSKITVTRAA